MRYSAIFCLLIFSSNCFAWECGVLELQEHSINEIPLDDTPIEKYRTTRINTHLKRASDIILGKVVSGKTIGENIEFQIDVIHNFKGNQNNTTKIKTTISEISPKITLGDNYLIFLYGVNEVDFCSIVINLLGGETSLEILKEQVRETNYYSPKINQVLSKVIDYES